MSLTALVLVFMDNGWTQTRWSKINDYLCGWMQTNEDWGRCQWMEDQVDNRGKSSCFKVVCSSVTDTCGTTSFVLGVSVGMVLPDHWNVRNVGVSSYGHSV